jgi:anthranilate synthase component 1
MTMPLNGKLKTVVQECPGDLVTPVAAYLRLRPLGARFLLESVEGGERSSRYSFVGLGARARLWSDAGGTWCQERDREKTLLAPPQQDPLDALLQYAGQFRVRPDPRIPRGLGGLVGYVGYDYARRLERLGTPPPGEALPELMFELVDELIVFDHPMHRVYFASLVEKDQADRTARRLDQVRHALTSALHYQRPGPHRPEFREEMAGADYCRAVEALQEHIRAGDIFQAVLSAEVEVLDAPPMFEIYRALRRVNPSPYMFFIDFGDLTIAGSSPESAVRLEQRRAALRPIAGTRPRGRDEEHDCQLERDLLASAKEGAEHAMLVDLARNDLSRVARPGSVRLHDFRRMERFSHVMHLVSDVEAELAEGCTAADLLRVTFPAGTVSGAPKIRAMQLIDEHESTRRNIYAGCVGYIGLDGTMDMALVIRTAVRAGGRTSIRAGAGIVAGSSPDGELNECRAKLAALVTAINDAAGVQS